MYNELYHHGILGQRWGIRRYQPYPKGYRGEGKEIGKAKNVQQKSIVSKIRNLKNKDNTAKKEIDENKENERRLRREKERERALREGTASEIYKYKNELTEQQLRSAVQRLNLEQNLYKLSVNEKKDAMKRFEDNMKSIQKGMELVKAGTDIYNTIMAIYKEPNEPN